MGKIKVAFAGTEVDGETLDGSERALLLKTTYDYIAGGNDWLLETFRLNEEGIAAAAMVAKDRFDAPIKGQLASGSEVGVQKLRPGHIMRDTTTAETPINTWDSESIQSGAFASGNDNWIGTGSANGTAIKISQYLVLVLFGITFTQGNSPVVEEVLFNVGGKEYPVVVFRQAWQADNKNRIRAIRFHPILLEPRQTILGQVNSIAAGRQELVIEGLAFGPARYLRNRSYAASDLP